MPGRQRRLVRRGGADAQDRTVAAKLMALSGEAQLEALVEALAMARSEGRREALHGAAKDGDYIVLADLSPSSREVMWAICKGGNDHDLVAREKVLEWKLRPRSEGKGWAVGGEFFKREAVLPLLEAGLLAEGEAHRGGALILTRMGVRSWFAHTGKLERCLELERAIDDEARRIADHEAAEEAARERLSELASLAPVDSHWASPGLWSAEDGRALFETWSALADAEGVGVVEIGHGPPVGGALITIERFDPYSETFEVVEVMGKVEATREGREAWKVQVKPTYRRHIPRLYADDSLSRQPARP